MRYFYDPQLQFCVPFFYKGGGGNLNRFDSDKNCTKACSTRADEIYPSDGKNNHHVNTVFVDFTWVKQCFILLSSCLSEMACSLPMDEGTCFAMFPKYYYNKEEKECRMFIYRGCQGNGNRFDSREDCYKLCLGQLKSLFTVCNQYGIA